MDALASTATKAAEMASRIPVNNAQSGHQVGAIMAFCDTILTIMPAGLMIAVCPIYIRWYHGMKMVTFTWDLACIKLISVIGLVVFEIMRFASWFGMQTNTLPFLTSTTAAASLLSTMASVTLGFAMFYDHFYSPQSTTFISLFLTVSVFAEALKAKYLPSFGRLDHLVTLTVGCMIAKAFLIVLLEIPKTLHSSTDANTKVSSGDRGGFWSRLWAVGALSHGFQNHLSLNELGSIGSTMESRKLLEKVEGIWDAADQTDPYALFKTCLHAFSLPLFVAWLTCIGPPVVRFISVLVKKAVLEYLQNPEASSYTKYQLLGGFASVQIMAAISESIFAYSCTVLSLHLRGALTGLLLRKQIRLPLSEAETSNLSTLITSDINSVTALIPEMCHVMTAVPGLTFGFYVLATMIGSAFVTPFCIIIAISASIGWYVGRREQSAMAQWSSSVQTRIAKTADFVTQIRPIKMIGLDSILIRTLQALGSQELSDVAAVQGYSVMRISAMPLNFLFLPLFAFRSGINSGLWEDGLDVVTPWVVLSLLTLVRIPMWYLLVSWPKHKTILASLSRIQRFLTLDEGSDPRQVWDFSTATSTPTDQNDDHATNMAKQREEEMKRRCVSLNMVSVPCYATPDINLLTDLDLALPFVTLTIVVGGTATNRTAFLKTILGEKSLNSGSIYIASPEMAHCGQKVWLPDDTIQNAIIGPAMLEDGRYDRVITACDLNMDIQTQGQTQIGLNGGNLSAIQRQKVVLARALYSLCPMVVCDDMFGLFDEHTAKNIVNAVFGRRGLLKEQKRTAVLVTSKASWLQVADQIVYLKEQGTADIHRGADAVQEFISTKSHLLSLDTSSETAQRLESTIFEHTWKQEQQTQQAQQAITIPTNTLDTFLLKHCFRSVPSLILGSSIFLIALAGSLERSQDFYVWLWLEYDPKNTNLIYGMVALAVVSTCAYSYNTWSYNMKVTLRIATQAHSEFYECLLTATLPFLSNPNHGPLLSTLSQDLTSATKDIPRFAFLIVVGSATCLTNFAFILAGIHRAFFLIPVMLLCFWLVQRFHVRALRQNERLELEANMSLVAAIREMTDGLGYIHNFGWQRYFLGRTLTKFDCAQKLTNHVMTTQRWLMLVMEILGAILVSLFFSMAILSTPKTSLPTLALSIHGMDWFAILCRQSVESITRLELSLRATKRLRDFEAETFAAAQQNTKRPETAPMFWPTHGYVEFQNVSIASQVQPGQPLALERVSATIESGQKVVVTGKPGSGKTTLLLSMFNFLDITSGKILVDGVSIAKISPDVLRTKITSIPAQQVELPGTLLENLLSSPQDHTASENDSEDADQRHIKDNNDHQAEATSELHGQEQLEKATSGQLSVKIEHEKDPGHEASSEVIESAIEAVEPGLDTIQAINMQGRDDDPSCKTNVGRDGDATEIQRNGDAELNTTHPIKITDAIVEGVLRDVGLWNFVGSRGGVQAQFAAMDFSTSQKQQVNIARSILHHIRFRTKIIVMDEPTRFIEDGALDMIQETLELAFGHCTRLIVSSEARDIAECDLILTLSNGWLVQADIVQRMDEELTNAFEKLTKTRPKSLSQGSTSQLAAPGGTTEEAPSQTNAQAAVAFEGEMLPGALADTRNPLDLLANRTTSDGSRDSARDSEDSESAIRLQPGTFSQGKLDHVVSTRATANEEMSPSTSGSASSPSSGAPSVYQGVVRAYKNHYIMDNGEQRVSYSLRRVDLRYKHHEHPYPSSVRRQIDMEEVDYWEVRKNKKSGEK